MKIAVAGATGLIGNRLCRELQSKGWEVIPLKRSVLYAVDNSLAVMLEDAQIVINLAGAPIIRRWTKANWKKIFDSRIVLTRNLVRAIHELEVPPRLFISTSATGIYENGGPYTESGFLLSSSILGSLCQAWEKEAYEAEDSCRVVIFRFGVVLDTKGGALARLLPFFKAGLGGPVASGTQFFPWIHLEDIIRAFHFVMENPSLKGVFNLTAPQIITNKQFTKALSQTLKRPAFLPIPAFMLYLLFGKGSTTLTDGQAVVPQRLTEAGFSFHFPDIRMALDNLLKT